ncbi:Sulfite reductase (NADPH) flavoprotein alpha-component [Tenacibaculum sp. 190524A02b]|uniref:NADPH--hemoprotein reductase n=1 Tax=Tenacibaculum vairaonense TaxID=3137860 RepID=A0ABM9PL37_9FLAO
MTISIWRYSHLTLAISSFVFILIASITGIILAFEPIEHQTTPYSIGNTQYISLANTINALTKEYKAVVSVKKDHHDFITASVITKEGKNATFYINPLSGKKLGKIIKRKPIYKFATSLHRSLFLKSTGRFIVGFISFLLCLIAITGLILIAKRQGGFLQLFSKVVKENFEQYYHIIIGRYTLIPIIIITVTGIYLSLDKFSLLPSNKTKHNLNFNHTNDSKKIVPFEFPVFKNISLQELESIEFPFSEDEEDYFFLKLNNKELLIHQYTGAVLSSQEISLSKRLVNLSLILHTGQGSITWSIILLLSCIGILFFIYSGFVMTFQRRKNNFIPKNKYKENIAEYVILVGSETGSTYSFANELYEALLTQNKTVFIDALNNYTNYNKCTHLIVLTATYGEGEPPINAKKFLKQFQNINPVNPIKYAVVGLGSMAYPKFCEFAVEVENIFAHHTSFSPILPLYKINNQSFDAFKNWGIQLSKALHTELPIKQPLKKIKKQLPFIVVDKTELNNDQTFLVRLTPKNKTKFTSGDLLSIYPKEDNIERLYSIGKIENDLLLSIKKHEFGICSNYLSRLKLEDEIQGNIHTHKDFHYPKKAKEVLFIANGTGIAPFLGMLQSNSIGKKYLFWGGRNKASYQIYAGLIEDSIRKKQLQDVHIAYSQENAEKVYVQDLITQHSEIVVSTLKNNGCIMICGSVAMMNATFRVIENITLAELNKPLDFYKKKQQIKTDCY